MKSPTHYMTSRRKSEDRPNWTDQLSPRIKSFRGLKARRHGETQSPQKTEEEFRIVHFPDRPSRRITQEEIPSEEECRAFLIGLRRASLRSQPAKSISEQDDTEEEVPEEDIRNSDETTLGLELAAPEAGRGELTEDGIMTARTYSPHPFTGQAKQVKLKKLATSNLSASPSYPRQAQIPPSSAPLHQEGVFNEGWHWRLSPSHLVRRPSDPDDGLRSHPVHVHVRTNSTSDLLCRLCHDNLAEELGVCQACSDEYATSDDIFPHRPPTLSRPKASIPHTLDQIACQHRATPSLTSNPESVTVSPPESPSQTVCTFVTVNDPPLTPLSALPTPHLLERLEKGAKDIYEEPWADYYFDEENFEEGERERKGDGVEAGGFMLKELSLEDYDRAFASPISPGPGWF